MTCLREDFNELFQVYADIILHPSFPDDELTNMRRLLLAALCVTILTDSAIPDDDALVFVGRFRSSPEEPGR